MIWLGTYGAFRLKISSEQIFQSRPSELPELSVKGSFFSSKAILPSASPQTQNITIGINVHCITVISTKTRLNIIGSTIAFIVTRQGHI